MLSKGLSLYHAALYLVLDTTENGVVA
jgi:hypothetical protein